MRKRVCVRCGMGMILSCPKEALPGTAAAFLILDYELRVSAISEAGERFFGKEKALIGSSLLDLVTSPLECRYYGAAPFLLGQGQAMQYSLRPRASL